MSLKGPDLNVPDLSKSELPKVVKKKKAEAKALLKKQKDKYTTLFRKKPVMPTCKGFFPKLPKIDIATFGIGGGFLMLILAWYSLQYYELFIPFASGALRLFKYFLICTAILYFMVTFVQASSSFYWWYTSTLYYFRRFVDPLLNQKVKYYYYYFTDYINWIIYYPAKAYYFGRFMANITFFLLVILPIMAFIAFFIGLLFSWIGEPKEGVSVMDPIVTDLTSAASVVGSAANGAMSKAADAISKATGTVNKVTGAMGNVAKVLGTSSGSSVPNLSKIDPRLDPSMLESIKGLASSNPSMLESIKGLASSNPSMLESIKGMASSNPSMLESIKGLASSNPSKLAQVPKVNNLIKMAKGSPFSGILDKATSMKLPTGWCDRKICELISPSILWTY